MSWVLGGDTNRSVLVRVYDDTAGTPETGVTSSTTGVAAKYLRQGGTSTAISLSDLSALNDAHSDGGLLHWSGGVYRLDIPDAAIAAGADWVCVLLSADDMEGQPYYIDIVSVDNQDAVRMGMTSLPNAAAEAAGGLLTRGTGAGQINQDASGRVDVSITALNGDASAAAVLERLMESGVLGAVDDSGFSPTTTQFETDLTEASDDHYNNQVIKFGDSAANPGYTATISDYDGTNKRITVGSALPNAPADGYVFVILGRID